MTVVGYALPFSVVVVVTVAVDGCSLGQLGEMVMVFVVEYGLEH